jgi:hypothetical protein
MADKCYSRDEETFYEDLAEVIDGMEEGATYYEGDKVGQSASYYARGIGATIIEHAQERAYDDAGEHAESFAEDLTNEKVAELEKLVADWMDANVPVNFWTVRNVKACEVTADLLAPAAGVMASDGSKPE